MRDTKTSWLKIGLQILGEEGVSALTVDRMTAALGLTKGSFYHHFKDIHSFKQALLDAWEKDSFEIIREITKDGINPTVLLKLTAEFEKRSPKPEIIIRAWAVTDKAPRTVIERLDAKRIAFLTETLTQILKDENRARSFAALIYAVIVGSLSMHPPHTIDQTKHVLQMLFSLSGFVPQDELSAPTQTMR